MHTYLHCLEQLDAQGVKTVVDTQGRILPIESAIEEQLKWVDSTGPREFEVQGNQIVRVMKVFVAGAVA